MKTSILLAKAATTRLVSITGMFYPSGTAERQKPRIASPKSYVAPEPLHRLTFVFSRAFLKKGC
jgi:hypothetical protein